MASAGAYRIPGAARGREMLVPGRGVMIRSRFSHVAVWIRLCAACAFGASYLAFAAQDDLIFRSGYEQSTCGNGLIEDSETCDDNNVTESDGCSATCREESGFDCFGSPSLCSAVCGDGLKLGNEQCDDGNTANGDGCSSACQVDPG